MGSHAQPVLDRLDRFVASRHRAGMNIGDDDAEMRADEILLTATIAARQKLAGMPMSEHRILYSDQAPASTVALDASQADRSPVRYGLGQHPEIVRRQHHFGITRQALRPGPTDLDSVRHCPVSLRHDCGEVAVVVHGWATIDSDDTYGVDDLVPSYKIRLVNRPRRRCRSKFGDVQPKLNIAGLL
jgi:hypothetical protein